MDSEAEPAVGRAPSGIEPLAALPVFFKLGGRTVLVAGGALPAVWKVELLAAAGATVRVVAEAPCPEMLALAGRLPDGRVTLIGRQWSADDLTGPLAIGDFEDEGEASAFREAARRAGTPVNLIDKPELCDFQFGTIVSRSPVVIGISTDGSAPVFGQALRARIEAVLPHNLKDWAAAAKAWRPAVQARNLSFRGRRRFWKAFSRFALSGENTPTATIRDACLAAAETGAHQATAGRIVLVGCGPGAVDDVTLRAIRALQSADVVVADADVPAAVLALSRREARKVDASAATSDLVVDLARQQHVVWLGTGNPNLCARWAERRVSLDKLPHAPVDSVPGLDRCPLCPDGCRFRAR